MLMNIVEPRWISTSSNLPVLTQGQTRSVALHAVEVVAVQGYASNALLALDEGLAARVQSISIAGRSVSFGVTGDSILLDQAPAYNFVADLSLIDNGSLTFSLLNGKLPPGLVLETSGIISGTVGAIVPAVLTNYEFTVRVGNNTQVRDRAFVMSAQGVDHAGYVNTTSLPNEVYDATLDLRYRNFGSYRQASAFLFKLDAVDPDGVLAPIVIFRVPNVTEGPNVFKGLPEGITIEGQKLSGIVSPDAAPGKYIFGLKLSDPITPSQLVCMIEVLDEVDDRIEIVPEIEWVTPAGHIGSVYEADPSLLKIEAEVHGVDKFYYTLAPGSDPLPQGLVLETNTGLLVGVAEHVDYDLDFSFTARISIGIYFEDRTFSLTVKSRYIGVDTIDFYLKPFLVEEYKIVANYDSVIPDSYLFRKNDSHFGFARNPMAYLIASLDGSGNIQTALDGDGMAFVYTPDFHGPVDLILGDHKTAVARNEKGEVVYEVIYRELFDGQIKAGGFTIDVSTLTRDPVEWKQSGLNAKYVFPSSLNNIRYDLVADLGFPVPDASKRYYVGPYGSENMPLWMKSQQVKGDDTSIIGFVPALPIAYVNPGMASILLKRIENFKDSLLNNGHVITFDRYYRLGRLPEEPISFDEEATTFDVGNSSSPTIFDEVISTKGKYYERSIGNTR